MGSAETHTLGDARILHTVHAVVAGGRRRRSGRLSGSRPTGSSCSCSRRPSRRPSTNRLPRTRYVCRTALCSPCRTCSLGVKTLPRSAACLPASESRQAGDWSLQGGDRGCGPLRSSGRRRLHHLLSSYSVRQTTNMRYMGSSALSLIMGVHIFPYQIVQRCGRNPAAETRMAGDIS